MLLAKATQFATVFSGVLSAPALFLSGVATYLTWRMYQAQSHAATVAQAESVFSLSSSTLLRLAVFAGISTTLAAALGVVAWLLYRSQRLDRRPRLAVEADWEHEPENLGGFKLSLDRPLTLVNDSDSPAFNVSLLPITLGPHTATFKCDSVVRRGKTVKAEIAVDGFGVLQQRDLHWMLQKESDHLGGFHLDVSISIFLDYEDSDRKQFETEQQMTYNVFTKKAEFKLIYQGVRRRSNRR